MTESPLPTPGDRQRFLESLWDLHSEIADEVVKPEMDPGRLMRLTALGVNHCLVGVASLLVGDDSTDEDPRQLGLFSEEQLTRCERGSTSGKEAD